MKFLNLPSSCRSVFNTMSKKAEDVVIQISNYDVKFVYTKKTGGKTVIQNVLHKRYAEGADAEIVQFLNGAYKDLKISTRKALCVIPSSLLISKNIDMPSEDRDEISKIIDLQSGRYTPYSRDEIVVDYLFLKAPDRHYTNVFLIIVHRKVIDRYFHIFQQVGLQLTAVAAASEGMAQIYQEIAGLPIDQKSIGGIHIDEETSELGILEQGYMVFIRVIPFGAKHFRASFDHTRTEFMKELNKSFIAYQNQAVGTPIQKLIVMGAVEGLGEIDVNLRNSVPYLFASNIPIQIASYRDYFQMDGAVSEKISEYRDLSFFDVFSCARNPAGLKLDLSPKEEKIRRRFREGGKDMMTLSVLIMLVFFMVSSYLAIKISMKNMTVQKLDQENTTSFEQARTMERVSTKSRAMKENISQRGKSLFVFQRITSLIGEDVYLSGFGYEEGGEITLAGTARSMSRVYSLVTHLEESGYCGSVKTNQTKVRREGDREVADFDLSCTLTNKITQK